MMKRYYLIISVFFLVSFISITETLAASGGGGGGSSEPAIASYACPPLFQVNAVEPNILIMLDNSGSMNFAAYGTWAGDEGIIRDKPYAGEPYNGRLGILINKESDDADERSGAVDLSRWTVHMGESSGTSIAAGLRFQNVNIPQGATITSAYIQFIAYDNNSGTANFSIQAEYSDNPDTYTTATSNVSTRSYLTPSVSWSPADWTDGSTYNSQDLTTLVQQLVNRTNWKAGNAMAFKITGTGYRRAYAHGFPGITYKAPMLCIKYADADGVNYYGYFNPEYFYSYSSNVFSHKYKKIAYHDTGTHSTSYWETTKLDGTSYNLTNAQIVSQSLWDGNWMNWLSMRRMDVLRKVLVGGLLTSRTGGGNTTAIGMTPGQSSRSYVKYFDSSSGSAVTPHDGQYYYGMSTSNNNAYVKNNADVFNGSLDSATIKVDKKILYEPNDFDESGNVVGILQRVGDKARWGNEWFYDGQTDSGGWIQHTMASNTTSLLTDLENKSPDTSTPLAEAYYVAIQYFKQEDPQSGLGYANSAVPNSNDGQDPYYYTNQFVPCPKSFVLLLTDGASTVDAKIPNFLKDYDGDHREHYSDTTDPKTCNEAYGTTCDYVDGGTDYLDDEALYARTIDLRSDLTGAQNVYLYPVMAFDDDDNARGLLQRAAKNGGYEEKDTTVGPNLQSEWDEDGDGIPDTYFEASDGYQLEAQLLTAINDMLRRSSSGTAVSVLSTSGEGEGTLVQAYFKPIVQIGTKTINWAGYLQSLWVDAYGNLREDTNQNDTLDVASDKIITTFLDTTTSDTKVKYWNVSSSNPYPDTKTVAADGIKDLDAIVPLWDAGKLLAERTASSRKIFTYIDKNQNSVIDETGTNLDSDGEIISFDTTNMALIKPYLGVRDNSAWSYLGSTQNDRATNLINYIRGDDGSLTTIRSRKIDYDADGTYEVWKLGDIIHSTPVTESKPTDNYHVIYADQSFGNYYKANANRETVVYVGANDGMLHAFTGGVYNTTSKTFEQKSGTTEALGDELWAYVPQALLPHLKWLPYKQYTHVYYVDLKPKIFDAKWDTDSDGTPDTWKTLMLVGLNLGGQKINVKDDFNYDGDNTDTGDTRDFLSSYSLLDVTDPRNPRVLWEKTYKDLDLTTSFPAVMKVKNKWYVVFGSGPTGCACTTTKKGHIFVVKLQTGEPYEYSSGSGWLFETADSNAMMNSPVTVDKDLNYNVDGIYFGESYSSGSNWLGKLYKVAVPWVNGTIYDGVDTNNYSDNPVDSNSDKKWKLFPLFNATKPITSSVTLSSDNYDNLWLYVGSGRYLSNSDKTSNDQQYMFGIKDPFFNKNMYNGGYYHSYSTHKELATSDLLNADPYFIQVGGDIYYDTNGNGTLDDPSETATSWGTWDNLLNGKTGFAGVRNMDGWIRSLRISGERIITRFAVLGGIVFTPSYVPSSNLCAYGGDSYLYGQYYETGTAYYKPVFQGGTQTIGTLTTVLDKKWIGAGVASSIGVHVGKEGSKGFIQTSTGTIIEEKLDTALKIKSGLKSWMEK
jgi:type IV pilus assembly protein PilY1